VLRIPLTFSKAAKDYCLIEPVNAHMLLPRLIEQNVSRFRVFLRIAIRQPEEVLDRILFNLLKVNELSFKGVRKDSRQLCRRQKEAKMIAT
jgi:hypothetical protein